MQLNLTQGDDWQIDWFLEELVGGAWVPVDITNIAAAQTLKVGTYEQPLIMTKINTSGGQFRATLSATLSAQAPVGIVSTQVQLTEASARTSTPPFSIQVYEDLIP